ncbi:MAG: hypothetical protein DMF53_21670 [Acidobacteria bacterium]|nr:MAG: hypothetical protein DMF53_21670 [Acidobacteriota bacterium]
MKKQKRGGRAPIEEIVSLNDELFSFVTGDPLAALDERLAMVAGGGPSCDTFTCSSFGSCSGFSCGTFKVN